jgi:hypothetical protein
MAHFTTEIHQGPDAEIAENGEGRMAIHLYYHASSAMGLPAAPVYPHLARKTHTIQVTWVLDTSGRVACVLRTGVQAKTCLRLPGG